MPKVGTARDRLLVTAGELMRRHGYAATGIQAILATSGAPAGSLYHHFPGGKEELAAAAVTASGGAYRDLVAAYFPPGCDVSAAARQFFVDAADMIESTDYADTCPIASIALETANDAPRIREAAAAAFSSWLAILHMRAVESGADDATARRLADELLMLLQGAFLLARVRRDADAVRRAGETAALLAERAVGVT